MLMPKNKKSSFKILVIALSVLWLIYIFLMYNLFNNTKYKKTFTDTSLVCINNHCFDSKIAETDRQKQQWLMYVENLPIWSGMIFLYDDMWEHSFWMKNTLIPLDIIRIDNNFKIVDFTTMKPCKTEVCKIYKSSWYAQYILEINSGLIGEYWIEIWDKIEMKI